MCPLNVMPYGGKHAVILHKIAIGKANEAVKVKLFISINPQQGIMLNWSLFSPYDRTVLLQI